MTQLLLQPVFLPDSSCVTRLDDKDRYPPSPPDFTPQERALIWDGLERLADEGRLKLISNSRLRIPDVCAAEGMLAPFNLRELANHEGWLP